MGGLLHKPRKLRFPNDSMPVASDGVLLTAYSVRKMNGERERSLPLVNYLPRILVHWLGVTAWFAETGFSKSHRPESDDFGQPGGNRWASRFHSLDQDCPGTRQWPAGPTRSRSNSMPLLFLTRLHLLTEGLPQMSGETCFIVTWQNVPPGTSSSGSPGGVDRCIRDHTWSSESSTFGI
jgi:hypothetical protein